MRVYGTMQPSRKRLHRGGWIKKIMAILRCFFPQSSIHTLGPYHAPYHTRSPPHRHLPSTITFATILHPPYHHLTPIQSSDYHFEQTAYLRRFPHSRSTSILCYFITVMSLYCRKTPYFRSIPSKNIELSFNFKQFHHTHAETSAF